jgi:hypothetical protein
MNSTFILLISRVAAGNNGTQPRGYNVTKLATTTVLKLVRHCNCSVFRYYQVPCLAGYTQKYNICVSARGVACQVAVLFRPLVAHTACPAAPVP